MRKFIAGEERDGISISGGYLDVGLVLDRADVPSTEDLQATEGGPGNGPVPSLIGDGAVVEIVANPLRVGQSAEDRLVALDHAENRGIHDQMPLGQGRLD